MFWEIIIVLVLMIPLVAVVLDSQLGRALAARLERNAMPESGALQSRIVTLESEVERLTATLQRLEEETEFLHRLLADRPAAGGALPAGDADD